MPDPALIDQQPFWAAALALLTGGLLWLWRGFSLGVKIGALAQEVKNLRQDQRDGEAQNRADFARLHQRFDDHLNQKGTS